MKVTTERLENSQAILNVEAEPEEMERSLEKAYRSLVARVSVPGFRKGKTPRPILERLVGREALVSEALEKLVPELYSRALEQNGLEAVGEPELELTQREPAVFKATVPLRPTIYLGDWRQVKLEPERVEVTPTQVEMAVQQIRYAQAPWQPVERPATFGDLVTLDVKAKQGDEVFWEQQGVQYQVTKGALAPMPGFAEQIDQMSKEEVKEFSLSYPADHANPELAGKAFSFWVQLQEVKEKRLPELNDDFARSVSEGFETLEQLRDRLRTNLKARAEAQARRVLEGKAVDAVVAASRLEFPPVLVEREVDRLLAEESSLQGEGGLEAYLQRVGKSEAEVRQDLHPEAAQRVRRSLVLGKLAEVEGLAVTDEEIQKEMESQLRMMAQKAEDRRFLTSPEGREGVRRLLLTRQTLDRLVEVVTGGKPTEGPAKDLWLPDQPSAPAQGLWVPPKSS